MSIEILYFEDCPSWQSAFQNLKTALEREGLVIPVHLVKIKSNEQANQKHFLGSPSICINNIDLWPEERQDYFLGCRIYSTPYGLRGWPTIDMITDKLPSIKSQI